MGSCRRCGEQEAFSYTCHRCGRTFCANHRHPERHACPGGGPGRPTDQIKRSRSLQRKWWNTSERHRIDADAHGLSEDAKPRLEDHGPKQFNRGVKSKQTDSKSTPNQSKSGGSGEAEAGGQQASGKSIAEANKEYIKGVHARTERFLSHRQKQDNSFTNLSQSGIMDTRPSLTALPHGILAYIASLGTIWFMLPDGHGVRFAVDISDINIAAWFHYSANHVTIVESIGGQSGLTTGGVNLIEQSGAVGIDLLYLIPVLYCVLFGGLAAGTFKSGEFWRGASVAMGYGLAMLVGAFIFSARESGFGITARMGPSYAEALIIGATVAALAGAVGGLLQLVMREI